MNTLEMTKTRSKSNPAMVRRQMAVRLMSRKRGATLDQLADKLSLEERQVRNLIDTLRRSGVGVRRVGPKRVDLGR